jgi:hypothetical protein
MVIIMRIFVKILFFINIGESTAIHPPIGLNTLPFKTMYLLLNREGVVYIVLYPIYLLPVLNTSTVKEDIP